MKRCNMNVLDEFLKLDLNGPALNIGVVGDAMVDEYFNCAGQEDFAGVPDSGHALEHR